MESMDPGDDAGEPPCDDHLVTPRKLVFVVGAFRSAVDFIVCMLCVDV